MKTKLAIWITAPLWAPILIVAAIVTAVIIISYIPLVWFVCSNMEHS